MVLNKTLKLSLVIPVYNEEHHIERCLQGAKNQTMQPYEIIIVDNNCTDKTIELAKRFANVKVIKQPLQGRGWARTAGFNAASGDIIGRIDADSKIRADWVQQVTSAFTDDESLMGLTGLGKMIVLPRVSFLRSTFWSRAYYWFVHASFRTVTLWGANMAIKKTAWDLVKDAVCNDDAIVHEDQDVSLCMAAQGMPMQVNSRMRISTFGQTYHYLPKLLQYLKLEKSTKARHVALGTFTSAKFRKLSLLQVLPGWLYGAIPGALAIVLSVFFWPLDKIMIKLGKQKTWLN